MSECIIPMKSQTVAEKARRVANSERIRVEIVSVDPSVTKKGCSFGIRLLCSDVEYMKRILERKNIAYGEIIGMRGYL